MRWASCFLAILATLLGFPAIAGSTELEDAREVLKKANIATDDQSLLNYFRKRTLSEADQRKLAQLIPQLGDNDFSKRERASSALLEAGQAALPFLNEALKEPDPEINRRARQLIEFMSQGGFAEQTCAVATVIQIQKPAGACLTLLAYLPFVQDEAIKEALLAAVASVGVKDGKLEAPLVDGLAAKEVTKRALCALIVGRFGKEEQQGRVEKLLTDEAAEVRFAAVQGLIAAKQKRATPALLPLLTEAPLPIAQQADDLLRRIAGEKAPSLVFEEKQRGKCREAWEAWWKANEAKLDLANADVELDFLDVGTVVKRAVTQFYALTLENKPIPFKNVAAVPYDFFGQTVTMLDDLEKRYTAPRAQNTHYTVEIKKVFTLAAYTRSPAANKDALTKLGSRQGRVVEVDLKEPNATHKIMVFVSVSGGQARVIGVRRFDEVRK
ncbi:MAG TPA: HEAT repeat domain-containing protein [Gemmataceae bacterium]|nr:HEAT repeat domain-containing protein [Gemmataceae bacterium]